MRSLVRILCLLALKMIITLETFAKKWVDFLFVFLVVKIGMCMECFDFYLDERISDTRHVRPSGNFV